MCFCIIHCPDKIYMSRDFIIALSVFIKSNVKKASHKPGNYIFKHTSLAMAVKILRILAFNQ